MCDDKLLIVKILFKKFFKFAMNLIERRSMFNIYSFIRVSVADFLPVCTWMD